MQPTFNPSSIHSGITAKAPRQHRHCSPFPAAASPAKPTLTPRAEAPWLPSPGRVADELWQRSPQPPPAAS